jgi:general secretion pathway protein M
MWPSPSPREQRIAALGLLALLLAAVYGLLVHSWFTGPMLEMGERLATLGEQQQRYTALLGQRDGLRQRLQQERVASSDAGSLLPGQDSSAAAAELMQRVSAQVKRLEKVGPGCVVVQRMPIIAEPLADAAYRPVKLSLDLECAIEPLTQLLHSLEYARPLLLVDQLDIARARQAEGKPAGGRLTVHLLITGYMAAGPTPGAAVPFASPPANEGGPPPEPSTDEGSEP